jgi:hypothetical protein
MSLEERFRDNLESQQRERITRDHNEKIRRLERELKELELEVRAISGLTGTPIQTIENHAPRHESGGTDEINGIIAPSQLEMPDDDATSNVGRTAIGGFTLYPDYAYLSHRDLVSSGNYALLQDSSGNTFLNASTSQPISFRINDVAIMDMDVDGLTFASGKDLTMDSGDIAGVTNILGPGDIAVKPTGDPDDYFLMRTSGGFPEFRRIGGLQFYISSDHVSGGMRWQVWEDTNNHIALRWEGSGGAQTGGLFCTHLIYFWANGDTSDYIYFETILNIPHIKTSGADLHIEPSTGLMELTSDVNITGDLLFTASGGGLAFGEMYVFENASETVIAVAGTYVQFVYFDTNGLSNNSTPDHTNDHITITKSGIYFISVSSHIESVAAGTADVIALEIRKNNGATRFLNIHAQRKLSGGGGDLGSISMSGLADLSVNDTIELWVANETTNKNIIIAESNMTLIQIGGT